MDKLLSKEIIDNSLDDPKNRDKHKDQDQIKNCHSNKIRSSQKHPTLIPGLAKTAPILTLWKIGQKSKTVAVRCVLNKMRTLKL